jgi:uncharacterized membrane protein YdjX (TVP38/TMEM64 family)
MKKSGVTKLAVVAVVVALLAAAHYSGVGEKLRLDELKSNADRLREYVAQRPATAMPAFVGLYVAVAACSIPGAAVLTLAAGFLFGAILGTVLVNIGATAGATLAFLFARYVIGDYLQRKFSERLVKFNAELDRSGWSYMLTLRLVFVFPFWLVNLLAGMTRVPLGTFIWTTSLGILPGSFVYAYAGRQLTSIASLSDVFTPGVLVAFVLLAGLSAVPVVISHVRRSH